MTPKSTTHRIRPCTPTFVRSLVFAMVCIFIPLSVRAATYPAAAKMINLVDDLGAVGDGKTDNTEVFRKMIAMEGASFFLPDGVYLISEPILYGPRIWKILEGQSRDGTIIRLTDNAPGFDDPTKPRAMFVTGQPPAIRFRTSLRNLTFDTGAGNPGAIGVNFYVNNQGAIRNVRIRSGEGGREPGHIGLAMNLDMVGPLLVRDLIVEGFDIGIDVKAQVNSVTLEDIELRGPREVGLQNWQNLVFVRRLRCETEGVAVRNGGPAGVMMLADSHLTGVGNAATRPGVEITHAGSATFLLRTHVEGFREAVRHRGTGENVDNGHIGEWSGNAPAMLHPGPARMLQLPVKELPEVPHDPDFANWADVTAFGANPYDREDDAPAIQRAIDSGATTVYFPQAIGEPKKRKPAYVIGSPLVIRGNVERIFGNEQIFEIGDPLLELHGEDEPFRIAEDKPVFRLAPEGPKTVTLERLGKKLGQKFNNPFLLLDVNRDVVVSSTSGLDNLVHKGPGVLYVDDVVGSSWKLHPGAELYAWQLNLEGDMDYKLDNNGGLAWILGLKTEHRGPILMTRNGGRTEVLGAHLYTVVPLGVHLGQIFVKDASFAMAAGAEYAWTRSWATEELVRHTRNGETKSFHIGAFARRGGGSMLPFISLIDAPLPSGSPPAPPRVAEQDVSTVSVSLRFESEDPDNDLMGFWVEREGEMPAHTQPPHRRVKEILTVTEGALRGIVKPNEIFIEENLPPDQTQRYRITAFDAANRRSDPLILDLRTLPDTEPPRQPDFWTYQVFDVEAQLRFRESTDNVAVTGYRISRLDNGKETRRADIPAPDVQDVYTWKDDRVQKGATHRYHLTALDAAGNESEPALLEVEIPTEPPSERILEIESFSDGVNPPRKQRGHITSLLAWSGMRYEPMSLGREKPFNRATLRYALGPNQAGALLDVYLNAELVEVARRETEVTGGIYLGTFLLESTGSYQDFKTIDIPLNDFPPGEHTVVLRTRPGINPGSFNAVGNLDKLIFSYYEDEAAYRMARAGTPDLPPPPELATP